MICVDWDGTVRLANGQWAPGVWEALKKIQERHTLMIHTCRLTPGIGFDVAAEHLRLRAELDKRGIVATLWGARGKPVAEHYIDDRAWRYGGSPSEWAIIASELAR